MSDSDREAHWIFGFHLQRLDCEFVSTTSTYAAYAINCLLCFHVSLKKSWEEGLNIFIFFISQ